MLKTFRANRNKLLGFIVVGFCALLMAGFGLGSFFGPQQSGPIAKVGDYEISYNQLRRKHEQLRGLYRQRFGENFPAIEPRLNLKQQAVDALINDRVIEEFAQDLGLTASKRQVELAILNNPYFGGQFDESAYKTFLRSTGLTGGQLERITRDQIVRDQLTNLMKDVSSPSAPELSGIRAFDNTAVTLDYVEIDPNKFEEEAKKFDEQALADFYESQKARYQVARQLKFTHVTFAPNDYEDAVEVLDEDVEIYYEDNSRKFKVPRQYHLRQIVFTKPSKKEESAIPFLDEGSQNEENSFESSVNSVEAVKGKAKRAKERLEAGEDFAALAAELSDDTASKNQGGSMGFVSVTDLDPKIRKAADDLAIDDFSEVIETEESFRIIYVQEMKDSSQKPLEDVRAEIVDALKKQDAPLFSFEAAQTMSDKFNLEYSNEGTNLLAFAKKEKLKAETTGGFVGFSSPGTASLQLLKEVINLEPGDTRLIESGDTAYIVEIEDVQEAHIPELSQIKEKVTTDYIQSRKRELAQQLANKIVEGAGESNLAQLAQANNLTVLKSKETLRKDPAEGVFMLPNLREKAFRAAETGVIIPQVFPFAGKFVVASLAKKEIKEEAGDKRVDDITISAREAKQGSDRLLESLIQVLRAKKEIWVDTTQLLGEA